MKIAVPTQGNNGLKEKIHDHFGSAPYFTVWDSETREAEVVENVNLHHVHGACRPLQALADLHVDTILVGGMGRRAVMLCNQGGIKVFRLVGETVGDALGMFERGEIVELTPETGCRGHNCT